MLLNNIAHIGSFKHFVFVYLRICVFVYFTFDTLECHIRYPWIPSFSKIYYMLGPFTFTLTFTLESEEFEKFKKVGAAAAGSLLDPDNH